MKSFSALNIHILILEFYMVVCVQREPTEWLKAVSEFRNVEPFFLRVREANASKH